MQELFCDGFSIQGENEPGAHATPEKTGAGTVEIHGLVFLGRSGILVSSSLLLVYYKVIILNGLGPHKAWGEDKSFKLKLY